MRLGRKCIFIIMFLLIVSLTGCGQKLFIQLEGKTLGVYIIVNNNEPQFRSFNIPKITDKLIKSINYTKKMEAKKIEPDMIDTYGDYTEKFNREKLINDLGLDLLVVIKLNEYLFTSNIKTEPYTAKSGPVTYTGYRITGSYDWSLKIEYEVYDKDSSEPIFSGKSRGNRHDEFTSDHGNVNNNDIFESLLRDALLSTSLSTPSKKE